jgi:HD-GYP domain-containing protein (c-di-GMP phosphodiesterase class II)
MSDEAHESIPTSQADQAVVLGLAALIRTAGYFDASNAVMREVSSALAAQIEHRAESEGFVQIGVHSHCVFVGQTRVRCSLATYERFALLTQLFADRGINALVFQSGLMETELATLASALAREGGKGADEINQALSREGVQHISVDMLGAGSGVQAVAPVEAYAAAVQLGEKLREGANAAKQVDVRQARRVTQVIVDQLLDDPRSLIALTTIKELDDRLISHSANVAILSVLLGRRLGLSKSRLGELCLAGFLHDAGKLEVHPEVLGKPGPLDPSELEEMRKHPLAAARSLLGGRRLTPATMRAVVVAYEHHLNYDMTGYPPSELRDHVSLFGNIVAIADRYDALTTARTYRRFSFSPHEVLGYLIYYSGTSFDPMLVKLFVELMGLYPPGTLLLLDDGELAAVCEPPESGRPIDQPRVRMWTGRRKGKVVQLGEQADGTTLQVATVLSPAGFGQVPAMDLSLLEVTPTRVTATL